MSLNMQKSRLTSQEPIQPITIPEERLLVLQPFHITLCDNNLCAAMLLALCIDRHNRFGWTEHHVTQKSLREDTFRIFGKRATAQSFNLLIEKNFLVPVKKHYPGKHQPFKINAVLINAKLTEYKSIYPINKDLVKTEKTASKPLGQKVSHKKHLRKCLRALS